MQISGKAFQNCHKLELMSLKKDMLILGKEPFAGCTSLLFMPTLVSVSNFDADTFKDCTSLEELEFNGPHEVQIYQDTFNNCPNLKKMRFLCKVKLNDYLKNILKNIEIEAVADAENIVHLAYEGYSVKIIPKMR